MKIVLVLYMCFLFGGCVTLNSVKEDLRNIDYSDGVDEREAVAIARMSMINSKLHGSYQLWTATTYNFSGYWKVVFLSLYYKNDCIIVIEKNTGDILAFFEPITDDEKAMGSNPPYSVEDWKRVQKFD